jgi:type I restriction enzyme S subunit
METKSWPYLPFSQAVESHGSGSASLPQKKWSDTGRFPVIGQGIDEPEAWTDREDLLLTPSPAVVLYGGHTRRVKHVSHPFVPGPNVKILKPISELDSKFLYYFLRQLPIESKGYADHFPLVRKFDVPVPPLAEQQRIVRLLDEAFEGIAIAKANAEKNLQNAHELLNSQMQALFGQVDNEWREVQLEQLCTVDWGNTKLTKSAYVEGGEYLAVSAAGCDGRIGHKEHARFTPVLSAIGAQCGRMFLPDEDFTAIKNTITLTPKDGTCTGKFLYRLLTYVELPKRGAAQPFISKGDIQTFSVNVPPLTTQERVVELVEKLEKHTDELAQVNGNKLAKLDALKHSLLHQAFTGDFKVLS